MRSTNKLLVTAFFTLLLLFAEKSMAQVSQGSMSIGGYFSLQAGDGNDRLTLVPDFSYFVAQNISVGGRIGFTYHEVEDDVKPVFNIYGRGHKFVSENFALFGEAFLQYAPSAYYRPYGFREFSLGVMPGFTYFFTDKFAVESTVGAMVFATDDTGSNFHLSLTPGAIFNVGLRYYMRK